MIAAGSLRLFFAVSLAASLCPRAWASPWALDPSATRIEFSVRNLSVARVDGTFRVARYPTIAFRSTRIERADGGGHWRVTGDLTLLGRTRPVPLDVDSSTSEGTRSSAHATTTIDRRDFGMTYAGFAVGKQVVITIDAVGMHTAADASLE